MGAGAWGMGHGGRVGMGHGGWGVGHGGWGCGVWGLGCGALGLGPGAWGPSNSLPKGTTLPMAGSGEHALMRFTRTGSNTFTPVVHTQW